MALTSVPGYVPGGFNAKQIRAYNSSLKKPSSAFGAQVANPNAYAPTITSTPGYMSPAADRPGYVPSGGPVIPTLERPAVPSFDMQIQGDPLWQNATDAFASGSGAGRASLREQFRNAVIQSGYGDIVGKMPSDLSEYGADLNQETLDTAAQNPLSARAQLQGALDKGKSQLLYQLAARGVLRSGELEVGNTGLQQQYDVASNQQQQDLLTALRGGVGQYRGLLDTLTQNRNAALEAIATRLAQGRGPVPGETPATIDTAPSSDGLYPTVDVSGARLPVVAKPKPATSVPASSPYYYGGGGRNGAQCVWL
jgi:hypothetical protein